MIWLWRFLTGYLSIKIGGENAEQILNKAAVHSINIWNLKYKSGSIFGNILPRDFFKLYNIRHGIKSKISIIEKHGLFFRLKKHKARTSFVLGSILYFFILLFLSNFVWIINVEGNHNLKEEEIITSCKKIGIYEGISKGKLNNKYDAQRLQLTQKGIAWCSLNLEGCILTVNVSETVPTKKEEEQLPTNLKASVEGKIKKIDVSSGNVMIKVGDTVSKGDLLVSGVIKNNSSTLFVHSKGEILAETKRVFTVYGDYEQNETEKTGERITRYTVDFFNINIPFYLGNIKKPHKYSSEINTLSIFGKKIPIKIAAEKYEFTRNKITIYSEKELEEMLNNKIETQVKKQGFISAVEQDRVLEYTDKGIRLKITYICEENIAVQDNILIDSIN